MITMRKIAEHEDNNLLLSKPISNASDADSTSSTKKSTSSTALSTSMLSGAITSSSQSSESKLPISEDPILSSLSIITSQEVSRPTNFSRKWRRIVRFLNEFHPAIVKQAIVKQTADESKEENEGSLGSLQEEENNLWEEEEDSCENLWEVIQFKAESVVGMHCPARGPGCITITDVLKALCTQFTQEAKDAGFNQASIDLFNKSLRSNATTIWLEGPAILNRIWELSGIQSYGNYIAYSAKSVFSELPGAVGQRVLSKFVSLRETSVLACVNSATRRAAKKGRVLDNIEIEIKESHRRLF